MKKKIRKEKDILYELHHRYRAHIATLEGLFNITVYKSHPNYKYWKKEFSRVNKLLQELAETYIFNEDENT